MQYLQIVRGDTALLAALQMLPLTGAMIPISRQAPRLTARVRLYLSQVGEHGEDAGVALREHDHTDVRPTASQPRLWEGRGGWRRAGIRSGPPEAREVGAQSLTAQGPKNAGPTVRHAGM